MSVIWLTKSRTHIVDTVSSYGKLIDTTSVNGDLWHLVRYESKCRALRWGHHGRTAATAGGNGRSSWRTVLGAITYDCAFDSKSESCHRRIKSSCL